MNEEVRIYVSKFPHEVIDSFHAIRCIILDAAPSEPEERLWAKLPSYYVGSSVVRLIAFKDHINIEASATIQHRDKLSGYSITPKGMLQIFIDQKIPADALKQIFTDTLIL